MNYSLSSFFFFMWIILPRNKVCRGPKPVLIVVEVQFGLKAKHQHNVITLMMY